MNHHKEVLRAKNKERKQINRAGKGQELATALLGRPTVMLDNHGKVVNHSKTNQQQKGGHKMNLPTPTVGTGSNSYLKATDIPNGNHKTKLTVLGNIRESNSNFGEGIEVDVKLGSKTFTFTVKFASGNYTRLLQRFGKDSSQWKGTIAVVRGEYLGKEYVKVLD